MPRTGHDGLCQLRKASSEGVAVLQRSVSRRLPIVAPLLGQAESQMKSADRQRAYRNRKRGGPPRQPNPCGTRAAAARHRRRGEPVCILCLEAERAYMREAKKRPS